MLNIVKTELKLVTSGPDGKPWMLSFHFDNIIAETGSNQMSFWYREHPTMLAIQHMREDAMLWANSEPVIDPFDVYEPHELPTMSSLILEVQFIDAMESVDKEFNTLSEVLVYLSGQRETDFDWLSLHDNNTDMVIEGWSAIHQYIGENGGWVKTPDVCSIHCTHGKGLACPVCYDQTHRLDNLNWSHAESQHDLSQYGDAHTVKVIDDHMALNPFPPSKSACIAHRASELNLPHVDVSGSDLPRVERFGDLPDGTLFYMAQGYAYGSRQKYQKVLEDGGDHNAVYANDTNIAMSVPDMQLVFRA